MRAKEHVRVLLLVQGLCLVALMVWDDCPQYVFFILFGVFIVCAIWGSIIGFKHFMEHWRKY